MTFQALQGPKGELSIAVFEESSCVFYRTFNSLEFGELKSMCESFSGSSSIRNSRDSYPRPQEAYDRHYKTFTIIADSNGIYYDKMGPTARVEFDYKVEDLEKLYEEWIESSREIYSEHFGDAIFTAELDELTDCGEDCNRTDFSEFAEFEQTISFYAMLHLECSYKMRRDKNCEPVGEAEVIQ